MTPNRASITYGLRDQATVVLDGIGQHVVQHIIKSPKYLKESTRVANGIEDEVLTQLDRLKHALKTACHT